MITIFLCEIVPESEDIDRCLWVVVGDLPPVYLVTDGNPTAGDAFDVYTEEMSAWVAAVHAAAPIDDLIPVSTPPTRANADYLAIRLEFLKTTIRPMVSDSRSS